MYRIIFSDKAKRSLLKLDKPIQQRVVSYLEQPELLKNPKSFGASLSYNRAGEWRYRIGDYRIICYICGLELVVTILEVGHRKEIYR